MDDAYIIASSGLFVVMLDFIARRASPKFGEAMRRTFKPLVDVTVKNTASEPYWTNRLGPIRGLIAQWFVDMDLLRESEFMINHGNVEILEWKKSCLASSSTCAMAGALFASVGATSLQLPDLDSEHWEARALFASSIALGVMSTFAAISLHRAVANVTTSIDLRLWLCNGRPTTYYHTFDHSKSAQKRSADDAKLLIPVASSIPAQLLSEARYMFFRVALTTYLIGLIFYLHHLDWMLRYRFFVSVTGFAAFLMLVIGLWREHVSHVSKLLRAALRVLEDLEGPESRVDVVRGVAKTYTGRLRQERRKDSSKDDGSVQGEGEDPQGLDASTTGPNVLEEEEHVPAPQGDAIV